MAHSPTRRTVLVGMAAGATLLTPIAHSQTVPLSKAEAMVDRALAFVKANGKDAALAEFNKVDGSFVDGELYIYAYDMDGNCLALGANPKLVGKNLMEIKSSNGVYQIKEIIAQLKAGNVAHVDAEFVNPANKKVQPKSLIAKKLPDGQWFLGSGVYR